MTPFSVVIAARNCATTLDRCLQSLLQQTAPPSEIILVLNGCEDETPSLATRFANSVDHLRIAESPAADGVAGAAKLGCQLARHPLLARLDADDVAHHDRFKHQLATLEETDADLVTCRVNSINSLGAGIDRYVSWANTLQTPPDFLRERFVESPVIQPGVLMKKSSLLSAGGYQIADGPEDYDLWLRMLARGCRFHQAPEALLNWHDSPTRLTRTNADYSPQAMGRTKARHLARLPRARHQGVTIAGTGPQGSRMAKHLAAQNITVHSFFDVDPAKIGRTRLGIPILGPDDFGHAHRDSLLLGCVGHSGRQRVRELAASVGFREGSDFFACC